jgi:hypothetical protein
MDVGARCLQESDEISRASSVRVLSFVVPAHLSTALTSISHAARKQTKKEIYCLHNHAIVNKIKGVACQSMRRVKQGINACVVLRVSKGLSILEEKTSETNKSILIVSEMVQVRRLT